MTRERKIKQWVPIATRLHTDSKKIRQCGWEGLLACTTIARMVKARGEDGWLHADDLDPEDLSFWAGGAPVEIMTEGMAQLVRVNWLEPEDGGFRIPAWDRYNNPETIRKRRQRARVKPDESGEKPAQSRTVPDNIGQPGTTPDGPGPLSCDKDSDKDSDKDRLQEQDKNDDARRVLATVKESLGLRWRKPHLFLTARLNEGSTVDDCVLVAEFKSSEWKGTEQEQYIRQTTLYQPGKFEGYLLGAQAWKRRANTDPDDPYGWSATTPAADPLDDLPAPEIESWLAKGRAAQAEYLTKFPDMDPEAIVLAWVRKNYTPEGDEGVPND